VRTKDEVMGDIAAQVSSGKVGAERLQLLCDRHKLDDIDNLSAEIIKRSEEQHEIQSANSRAAPIMAKAGLIFQAVQKFYSNAR
jgi:N-methylhydantoinase B/oxoprolinase/acetone carboxylase alpha subunit